MPSGQDAQLNGERNDLEAESTLASGLDRAYDADPSNSYERGSADDPFRLPPIERTRPPFNLNTEQSENEEIILPDQDSEWQARKRKKQERIDRARREEGERQGDDYFPMYYTLRFPGTDIDTSLPCITAHKQILEKAGGELDIKHMGRYTLLLKAKSRQQGERILQITEIAGKTAEAKVHQSLNYSKGTVHSRWFGTESIQEIRDELNDQGVVGVERM